MSTPFKDMSADDQAKCISDLREMLAKHGLGDASIDSTREVVCNLIASTLEDNYTLTVKKEVSPSQKDAVDNFKEDVKAITDKISGIEVSVTCVVGAGQKYQPIEKLQQINQDGAEMTLTHNAGEVWLVDFWATWCPPCQKPMAHNQEMLEKKGDDWKKKNIRIVGISIDSTRDVVVKHVNDKKWTAVEHYFRGASDCSSVYGVRGVPHVMLVNQKGDIVFKGHPAGRPNLEEDLEKLAAGETLTGDGIVEPITENKIDSNESKKEDIPEGWAAVDQATVGAEIESFKEVCNTIFIADEELKKSASPMQRAFCVIVMQTKHLASDTYSKYENYRVLVGNQAAVDAVQKSFEENLKTDAYTFNVNNQVRAMP